MTQGERIMLDSAKVAYLKIIKYVKRLELEKAKTYLEKKNAEHGLCAFLSLNELHCDAYDLIEVEMERIGRRNDYNRGRYPKYAANREELIELLQYRIDLINQILA